MNTLGTSATGLPATRGNLAGWLDCALVVLVTALAIALCVRFNVSEAIARWTHPLERFQLDELPPVLLILSVSLVWFTVRRNREVRRENRLRRSAEQDLSSALAANRRLTQQYLQIQESERRALARDLHDEVGQCLNVLKLDVVSLRDRLAAPDRDWQRTVSDMIGNIDHVHDALLGLIRELRPAGLDELGLAAALEHCVCEWRRRLPHVSMDLTVTGQIDGLQEPRRLVIFRLVQEALTNIARHSRATRVRICLERGQPPAPAGDSILVSVEDNGVGVDPERTPAGLGLIGMRERVEAVGGSLRTRGLGAGGFSLIAQIPG